jgi:hypothetical protein
MPRVSQYRAGTHNDNRCTVANKVMQGGWTCPDGSSISATQSGTVVTVSCQCGCSVAIDARGVLATPEYVFGRFVDAHSP